MEKGVKHPIIKKKKRKKEKKRSSKKALALRLVLQPTAANDTNNEMMKQDRFKSGQWPRVLKPYATIT